MTCSVCQLGIVSYHEAYDLQQKLKQLRWEGKIPDVLLILEHPPTISLGKFGNIANVLTSSTEVENKGISICETDRGGDVTFHCPGQLIAYPIINLRTIGENIHRYINCLEEVAIRTLADFNILGERWEDHAGVWVGGKQMAAIGLHISHWITTHGLSLNVNPNLKLFKLINICGLPDREATSMSRELGYNVSIADVTHELLTSFSAVFKTELNVLSSLSLLGENLESDIAGLV